MPHPSPPKSGPFRPPVSVAPEHPEPGSHHARSAEHLRCLLDELPHIVWECGPDGTSTYHNRTWDEYVGAGSRHPDGQDWLAFYHPEDRALLRTAWRRSRALDGAHPYDAEARLRRHDGVYRWFRVRGNPVRDAEGRIVGWVGTCTDIDDQKQAEANLRESEERLRRLHERFAAALHASTVVVFTQDSNLRYTWIHNPALGFRVDEIIGVTDHDLFERAEDAERLIAIKRRVLETGVPAREEVPVYNEGMMRWYDLNVRPQGAHGAIVGVLCTAVDITERKQVEETLCAQGELLQGIIDHIPVLLCIWNPGLNRFRFNKHLREVLGWTETDTLDGDFMVKAYPDPAYRREITAYMLSLEPGWRDFKTTAKDGTAIDISWANVRLSDGTSVGIGIDIRERKRAEAALRDSQARLQIALAAGRMGTWVWDIGTQTVLTDALHRQLWEIQGNEPCVPLEEILGRVHPGDLPPEIVTEGIKRLSWPFDLEFRVIRRNGEPRWLRGWGLPQRDADGMVRKVIGVNFDITERKQAEDALRRNEAKLRAVFRALTEGVVFLNTRGEVEAANEAVQRAYGHALQNLMESGRDPRWQIIRPDGSPFPVEEQPAMVALRTGQAVRDVEMGVPTADGKLSWRLVNAQPVYDDQGRLLGAVASFFDITERRHMEEALREADRRKDEFLAMLAHELRNPLAPIRNSLHVLRKIGGQPPAAERVQVMMARQLDHLVRLVDDLLEVSRITRGKIGLRKEPIDLAAIIGHAVETSEPLIKAGRHELSLSLPPEPLRLSADPVRLAQVLANLLNNAAKYTERGGTIRLTAERRSHEAVVSIRDTGVGIPAEMLPRVFDLFTQVDRSIDRSQGGLGIGLALVRRLVEMHGGRVEARSEGPGRGSEFLVHLPLDLGPG